MKRQNLLIRRIWKNTNSTKDQYTVQFFQVMEGSGNPLLSITQNVSFDSKLTALVSFSKEQCEKVFGTLSFDPKDANDPKTFMAAPAILKGYSISVVENTTQNPNNPNQTAKINPKTAEVLTINGNPIYRHTDLVPTESVQTILLKADTVPVSSSQVDPITQKQEVV